MYPDPRLVELCPTETPSVMDMDHITRVSPSVDMLNVLATASGLWNRSTVSPPTDCTHLTLVRATPCTIWMPAEVLLPRKYSPPLGTMAGFPVHHPMSA